MAVPQKRSADPFAQPVHCLRGVGARIGERLDKLGVATVGDLLCLLPLRYEDRTRVLSIGAVRPGHKVLIQGKLELAEVALRRRRSLLCRIADRTGSMTLRFFHFSKQQEQQLVRGVWLRCFGEVRAGPTGLEMVHPEYRLIESENVAVEASLTPVYPTTEGLHQQRIRQLMNQALALMETAAVQDHLGPWLDASWSPMAVALQHLHRPPAGVDIAAFLEGTSKWHKRLALEELIAYRLSLKAAHSQHGNGVAPQLGESHQVLGRLYAGLSFKLTGAQQRVIGEILADLKRPQPMHRLVQGDVGCGKTIVAAAAAAIVAANGKQVAIMAPTELLAEQHYANFTAWFEPLHIDVALLTGSQKVSERTKVRQRLAGGEIKIVVGTHALFQEGVDFAALALVVIDEQHRFGVEQRLQLWQKGATSGVVPHQLIMTATPIPRTLAMTAYADLDCSTVDEMPPGRTPVKTVVMQERRRADLVARIVAHCQSGQQAYWVCPLIDESEVIDSSAAAELERELSEALPGQMTGLVHGRMRPAEKDAVMRDFKAGKIDVLVATTVIEVGVDVPNATLMIVENAERMGLSQLHQLRGRVGRGAKASSCVLLYKPPLGEVAKHRLEVMRSTNDGFKIAENDLRLRGAGEMLGTKQTGAMRFRVADLLRDADLLNAVVRLSDKLLTDEPAVAKLLVDRWSSGGREYVNV